MALDRPIILTMPNDLGLLGVARKFVEAVCTAGGVEKSITDNIVLAANEAIGNVIRHAHKNRPEAEMRIECQFRADGIELRFFDEGEPFDLEAVPRLDPAEIRLGGRGIFLMRSIMDELRCEPRSERGNVLRMFKRCARKSLD